MNRYKAIYPHIIITAGMVFRGWELTRSPLWYDESFTQLISTLPLDRLITATAGDVHPPAYYLLVWAWFHLLGDSAFTLRLLSVILGLLGLLAFYRFTGIVQQPPAVRLLSLGLLAFHPVAVFYSQEGRMYTLLLLLAILQVSMVREKRWGWYTAVTVLGLYTHNYFILYTAVVAGVGLLWELQQVTPIYRAGVDGLLSHTGIIPLAVSTAVSFMLFIPWGLVLLGQMKTIAGGYWIQTLTAGGIVYSIIQLLGGYNIPDPLIPWAVYCIGITLGLLAISAVKGHHYPLLLLAVGPLALAVIGSWVWKPVLLYRGLIGTLPWLAMLGGYAIYRSTPRGRVTAGLLWVPMLVTLLWQVGVNHNGMIKGVPLWPVYSGPMVHLDDSTLILFQHPEQNYLLDGGCPEEGGALTHQTRAALGYRFIDIDNLPSSYVFTGVLSPLSTPCHIKLFQQITSNAVPIYEETAALGKWGIYAIR